MIFYYQVKTYWRIRPTLSDAAKKTILVGRLTKSPLDWSDNLRSFDDLTFDELMDRLKARFIPVTTRQSVSMRQQKLVWGENISPYIQCR